jgi:hypothetical protein
MLTKKDWEQVLENTKRDKDSMQRGYELSMPQFDMLIEFCKKKISEFPADEVPDPKPEGVDELLNDLK